MKKPIILKDKLTSKNIDWLYRFYPRCSIWRGYTESYELLPEAANYDSENVIKALTHDRSKKRFLPGEIARVFHYFNIENTNGNYPFAMPYIFSNNFYQPACQREFKFLEKLYPGSKDKLFYPATDKDYMQVLSFVQHKHQGTSLIDFSENPFKALFFALGKEENFSKDSYLLGINTTRLETNPDIDFYIYKPAYFLNKRIQHQNGLFLYEKIQLDERLGYDENYNNILYVLKNVEKKCGLAIKDFSYCNTINEFDYLYCLLEISSSAKPELKVILENMGITKEYLLDCKI